MLHDNLSVNERGELTFAGVSAVDMAKKYGTPLYLLDEERIRSRCRLYKSAMERYFGEGSYPLMASKALCFKGIYTIAAEEKIGIDLVSPGELYTALKAGFPLEKAYFHGNNKTDADILFAIESGVGHFVADNAGELAAIDRIAREKGKAQPVLLRITPGIDPHTHKAISTGKVDSKFGSPIETGQADNIVSYALSLPNVKLEGFHCHIGSQIFDVKPFCDAADIMIGFIARVRERFGFVCRILNLGGGFGVRYTDQDPAIDYEGNIRLISEHIDRRCAEQYVDKPVILMEPGRSLVADAGLTLYQVGSVKRIPGFKNYVSIDGGMTDNPRYALYQSPYTALIANKAAQKADLFCTIAGRCCESGDLIQENVMLQTPERGDYLAVLVTGAYNYSMASNYNRIPRPPVVLLSGGRDRLAVRRETYEDLVRLDV